MYMKDDNWQFP